MRAETTADVPVTSGFAMPAEWAPHASTWTSWPFDDALWLGHLEGVRREFAELVATIARFETVNLNVRDEEAEKDARTRLEAAGADLTRVRFRRMPLNDVWFRDNGPLFIRNDHGEVALTDWRFNAWGGKYRPWDEDDRAPRRVAEMLGMKRFEIGIIMEGGALELNSLGTCLTTRSCLLNQNRDPNLAQDELEAYLRDYLGVSHVIWLEGGLEDDHTDGHIDTIVRFCDDETILCAITEDEDDANYEVMQRNLHALRALRDQRGKPYRVVELPLPAKRLELEGKRLPLTYANFYIGNGFVVVPVYDDANDAQALAILRPLFPGREVIPIRALELITGGGAWHCVTQQQPRGEVCRG
jgi:agmatine deiminase